MSTKIIDNGVKTLPEPLQAIHEEFKQACMDFLADPEGSTSFLESPDGTARSLALIHASLSLVTNKHQEMGFRRIVYICSTLKELQRVIEEFKSMNYADVPMVELNTSGKIEEIFGTMNEEPMTPLESPNKRVKVETDSKDSLECPVIIFSTHKFFFEELILQPLGRVIDLKDTVVIVDEAHEVDLQCRNAAGKSLSICTIESLEKDTSTILDSNVNKITKCLKNVFRGIRPHHGELSDPTYRVSELVQLLAPLYEAAESPNTLSLNLYSEVIKFAGHIRKFYEGDCEAYVIEDDSEGHLDTCQKKSCKTLKIVCLDPSLVIKRMIDCKPKIIFSSGSFGPLDPLKRELGIESSFDCVGKSFIEDYQVFARIVMCGAGGYFLKNSYSTFSHGYDLDYLTSLGRTISEFAKLTPLGQGLIVYFASHELLESCKSHWQATKIKGQILWDKIAESKDLLTALKFDEWKVADSEKGSCVLTVIHGEVPHDMPIERRRVNVIVGVPLLPHKDPKTILKQKKMVKDFREWDRDLPIPFASEYEMWSKYEMWEALKPVRAVLDHQIRTISQYSVLLLCDTGFQSSQLSHWMRPKIQVERRFSDLLGELKDFFQHIEVRMSWMSEKNENPTQFSTQFGNVKRWEIEKIQVEVRKLKVGNEMNAGMKRNLEQQLSSLLEMKKELEAKLAGGDCRLRSPLASPAKTDARSRTVSPSGSTLVSPLKLGSTLVSPLKSGSTLVSPLKLGSTLVSPLKSGLTSVSPLKSGSTFASPLKSVSSGGSTFVSPLKSDVYRTGSSPGISPSHRTVKRGCSDSTLETAGASCGFTGVSPKKIAMDSPGLSTDGNPCSVDPSPAISTYESKG